MYFLEIRTIAIIDSVNDIARDTHRIQGVVLYLVSKYLPIIKLNITGPIIQPDTLPKTCKYSLFNNDCFFCLSLSFSIKRKGIKPCACAWNRTKDLCLIRTAFYHWTTHANIHSINIFKNQKNPRIVSRNPLFCKQKISTAKKRFFKFI